MPTILYCTLQFYIIPDLFRAYMCTVLQVHDVITKLTNQIRAGVCVRETDRDIEMDTETLVITVNNVGSCSIWFQLGHSPL